MRVHDFFASLTFQPDPFQVLAAEHVEMGRSVVVTAPTGAGKTLVAEAAVHLSLRDRRRVFYTTPLKALSNQKFRDFGTAYGAKQVGLLTGDNTVNPDAPIVIMTTEVLRNMIYSGSDLSAVDSVILDEVHYLQDRFRGAVWEEVIIHAPPHIKMICLSATVANADEFTRWIRTRRGPTELVVETERPVRLERWWAVWDRFERETHLLPLYVDTPQGMRANRTIPRLLNRGGGRRRRFASPRQTSVVEHLAFLDLLPAIYFVFSRAGCESAADRLVSAGVHLTEPGERDEIRQRAEKALDHLESADLRALRYDRWLHRLQLGIGSHHAGLAPAFKEVVEQLFSDGLIKVVMATETLALGINMPARTVVIDRLSKFTGESHELLEPGEFTQLTGRAGRRGIDTVGHGVVLHTPFVPFDRIASIARLGSQPLRSSFRPTYNMVVNLVANHTRPEAERLLIASFAEFQDRHKRRRRGGSAKGNRQRSQLLRRFDRATRLLEQLRYIVDWKLTTRGQALRTVYSDLDLLIIETVSSGVLTGLEPTELVALLSTLVYEPRREEFEAAEWPTAALEVAWKRMVEHRENLSAEERKHHLPETRSPHSGFALLAYNWALRPDLEDLMEEHGIAPGDFVRITRMLLDLLQQVAEVGSVLGEEALAGKVRVARRAINHGVISTGRMQ